MKPGIRLFGDAQTGGMREARSVDELVSQGAYDADIDQACR
jgi:hypothetical protein